MNSLKTKRGNAKGRLTRAAAFIETIGNETPVEMLQIRVTKLDESWADFSSLHHSLLDTANENEVKELETEFGEYEDKYFNAHSSLMKAIHQRQSVSKDADKSAVEILANQQSSFLDRLNSTATNSSTINLPKISIPLFSGNYKDWPSFRDLFMGAVDCKPNLSTTQKFHYLKMFLRDDAANLIKHIPTSDSNYVEAWERLENRYDRVHLIVQSYIQAFLSLPSIHAGNVQMLRKLSDGADEVIRGLNAIDQAGRDPWIIYLLLNKVDYDTKQAWAAEVGARNDCTVAELLIFLQSRCDALESCQSLIRPVASRSKLQGQVKSHFAAPPDAFPDNKPKCPKCEGDHILPQCSQFVSLDIDSRRSFVKRKALCFNCLRSGHSCNNCRSTFRCRVCKSRHHSLVHSSASDAVPVSSISDNRSSDSPASSHHSTPKPVVNNHSLELGHRKQTILPTLLAKAQDNQGKFVNCRVLLDSGSQVSFIAESFAQVLGLRRKHARIPILGLSTTEAGYTKGCISLQLHSRCNSSSLSVDAFILRKLTSNLPSQRVEISSWPQISNLELADPCFNQPSPIDVLLGADKLWGILKGEQIQGPLGTPVAQNTSFGWVISGEVFDPSQSNPFSSLHSTIDVDLLLQRFWELEDVTPSKDQCFNEDQAEIHFRRSFSRSSEGKYIVKLPFKHPSPNFGNSLKFAVSRLNSMERRFKINPELHQAYSKFMQEYLTLGHMRLIPPEELDTTSGKHFYLPHHAVFKPESSSTKLRVVFDGSAKDSLGQSLNSQLLIGPPIQRDLVGVCLRFRQHRYVFTADIVKMFRQIWVHDQDIDYQRIVWRETPTEQMKHYRLCTVTYGTAPAPFLSVRVLKQLAEDYQAEYPIASRVLLRDVYVDDVMTGSSSVEGLIHLQREMVELLSKAKLELRKWTSNCWPLLSHLPQDACEFSWTDPEQSKMWIKVLGMFWSPASDEFSFHMGKLREHPLPTRRTLLSEISQIFDPLGFLAPSVVLFKILFQELWSSELKLGWDDPLPHHLGHKWMNYREELHLFEKIRVPRNITSLGFEGIQLHGFSDASSVAYAAVIFARCKTDSGEIKTTIIAAKTKVAPLKPVTIPRLELCAALLLARLFVLIKSSISTKISKVFAWCDSEIVLHWLSSPPRRWNTFVANRTATILESIPRHSWHHIASESNPADCASRGILPSTLINHNLWWRGPSWLSASEQHWPISSVTPQESTYEASIVEERRLPKVTLATTMENDTLQNIIVKISSWNRLQRIVAYCLRFLSNCQTPQLNRNVSGISLNEIQKARLTILKHVQQQAFADEIHHLTSSKNLPTKSPLIKLSPFVDQDGVLRVGGRIKQASVSYNIKHPIILPNNNHVSFIIVKDLHIKYLHIGVSATFVILRQQYWILGSRNLIRKIVHSCKPCFMQRKHTSTQLMGDLPAQRIQQSRPFSNTGCDYAGPLTIKFSRGRNPKLSKAYIALFVCMSTKAIHLEVVSDLTTDAFLAALRRFVSRRGKCSNIYTDNGSNFLGARRCLNEMHKVLLSQTHNDDVAVALAKDGISWHFIPPSAPHFGGLWEAGVRSVKLHLRRVIGSSILTFEELYTLLTQIEAILNSRPLCSLSDDDINPLTPAHFIIGEPLTAVPEPNLLDIPPNRLTHWKHIQSMVQGFWKRWQMEYITTLQERSKWQHTKTDVKPGDLVVIKEPNLPPSKWLLGRVQEVTPGPDNRIRVATIITKRGTCVRSIAKLAVLPMS